MGNRACTTVPYARNFGLSAAMFRDAYTELSKDSLSAVRTEGGGGPSAAINCQT